MTDAGNQDLNDATSERSSTQKAEDDHAPHSRSAAPLGEHKHDHLADTHSGAEDRQEALVDEGVEETFPASDPVSAKRIT